MVPLLDITGYWDYFVDSEAFGEDWMVRSEIFGDTMFGKVFFGYFRYYDDTSLFCVHAHLMVFACIVCRDQRPPIGWWRREPWGDLRKKKWM